MLLFRIGVIESDITWLYHVVDLFDQRPFQSSLVFRPPIAVQLEMLNRLSDTFRKRLLEQCEVILETAYERWLAHPKIPLPVVYGHNAIRGWQLFTPAVYKLAPLSGSYRGLFVVTVIESEKIKKVVELLFSYHDFFRELNSDEPEQHLQAFSPNVYIPEYFSKFVDFIERRREILDPEYEFPVSAKWDFTDREFIYYSNSSIFVFAPNSVTVITPKQSRTYENIKNIV